MRKSIKHFNCHQARYIGNGEEGCYYHIRKKGWLLRSGWYVTVVPHFGEFSAPRDEWTDRGPLLTEEKAWRVAEEMAKQLHQEQLEVVTATPRARLTAVNYVKLLNGQTRRDSEQASHESHRRLPTY
jgi:hypothetical protein